MKLSALLPVMIAAALLARADVRATACSSVAEPVAVSLENPDMPLVRFAAGDLGILRPTLARSYLVVAFRTLEGLPLDPVEQAGALTLWAKRLSLIDAKYVDPSGRVAAPPERLEGAVQAWRDARGVVPGSAPVVIEADYYDASDYTVVPNCMADAFHTAAARLRALVTEVPPAEGEARQWLAAQDQVFANCSVSPHPGPGARAAKSIPAPLPPSARAEARADRGYQIASATFYAGELEEAERLFRAIDNAATSPYRPRARYLLARVLVRRAATSKDALVSRPLYERALATLDSLLGDPSFAIMASAARRYRTLVLSRLDPGARVRDASVRLGSHVGWEMEDLLADYTVLLDKNGSPLALTGSDADRLSAWIGIMKSTAHTEAFDRALSIYAKSPSVVWLVAALVTAQNAQDSRLAPLLEAARAVPPTSPAFPTLAIEWARLSRARGLADADVYAALRNAAQSVSLATPSTKNAFILEEARTAPTLSDFALAAALTPAGIVEDGGATYPDPSLSEAIPDDVANLMKRLPLSSWRDLALAPSLPRAARGAVTAAAWTRALLLGDLAAAHAVAPAAVAANPPLAAAIGKVDGATSPLERRIAFLAALLHAPRLGPDVDAWETHPTGAEPIESSSAGYLWCKVVATAPPSSVAFLGVAERAAATKETSLLSQLGSGPTFVALEATALAKAAPSDLRIPELLHLAVRMTRFGCRDERNLAASRGAFDALHAGYPASPWAAKTPYYYGPL